MGRAFVAKVNGDLAERLEEALEWLDWKAIVKSDSRVFIKPNFTYPSYKEGVTTSPALIEALVKIVKTRCSNIAIGETDGGYHAWKAEEAFLAHGLYELQDKYGVQVVNLYDSEKEYVEVSARGRKFQIPLPRLLTHDTDVFISAPVLKVHSMTQVTFGLKNQWGCILDPYRMKFHHIFPEAVLEINRRLHPRILVSDPFFALTDKGPMDGTAFHLDTLIAATDVCAFERIGCEILGVDPREVQYLAHAERLGELPSLASIEMKNPIEPFRTHRYSLNRTGKDRLVRVVFGSQWLTYLLYYSGFGQFIHKVFYSLTGKRRMSSQR